MAEIVNLRLRRKQAIREERAKQAAENRARHGQSGAEKSVKALEAVRAGEHLDAHKRERGEER